MSVIDHRVKYNAASKIVISSMVHLPLNVADGSSYRTQALYFDS